VLEVILHVVEDEGMPAITKSKTKSSFVCQDCGYQSPKWLGRCPECQSWNTLVEEVVERSVSGTHRLVSPSVPCRLDDVAQDGQLRLQTGIGELDRVLGDGLVLGSVVLLGGEPGIGKSTLLLWALGTLSAQGIKTLYVSGEESMQQVKLRADRLGIDTEQLYVVSETDVNAITRICAEVQPRVLVVDSIQVLSWDALASSAGSVGQVRECAAQLIRFAKESNVSLFLVGHITKDGALAGPKVVEHLVDAVCAFEGDAHAGFRMLRASKNRFGSTSEIGVFQMSARGLEEVSNPSESFLAERHTQSPGSIVTATLEGSRPLLVEVQALVTPSNFGIPRRRTSGVDPQRVDLVLAVLEQRAGLVGLGTHDIFVSASGGMRLYEPAADLAIAVAIASSLKQRPSPERTVAMGEIGLTGEVRSIIGAERRVLEAHRLGFTTSYLGQRNAQRVQAKGSVLVGVASVHEALQEILGGS
jgi:DNA repair protein RadA/Sms